MATQSRQTPARPPWPDGTLVWLKSEGEAITSNLRVVALGGTKAIGIDGIAGAIDVTPPSIEQYQMRALKLADLPPLSLTEERRRGLAEWAPLLLGVAAPQTETKAKAAPSLSATPQASAATLTTLQYIYSDYVFPRLNSGDLLQWARLDETARQAVVDYAGAARHLVLSDALPDDLLAAFTGLRSLEIRKTGEGYRGAIQQLPRLLAANRPSLRTLNTPLTPAMLEAPGWPALQELTLRELHPAALTHPSLHILLRELTPRLRKLSLSGQVPWAAEGQGGGARCHLPHLEDLSLHMVRPPSVTEALLSTEVLPSLTALTIDDWEANVRLASVTQFRALRRLFLRVRSLQHPPDQGRVPAAADSLEELFVDIRTAVDLALPAGPPSLRKLTLRNTMAPDWQGARMWNYIAERYPRLQALSVDDYNPSPGPSLHTMRPLAALAYFEVRKESMAWSEDGERMDWKRVSDLKDAAARASEARWLVQNELSRAHLSGGRVREEKRLRAHRPLSTVDQQKFAAVRDAEMRAAAAVKAARTDLYTRGVMHLARTAPALRTLAVRSLERGPVVHPSLEAIHFGPSSNIRYYRRDRLEGLTGAVLPSLRVLFLPAAEIAPDPTAAAPEPYLQRVREARDRGTLPQLKSVFAPWSEAPRSDDGGGGIAGVEVRASQGWPALRLSEQYLRDVTEWRHLDSLTYADIDVWLEAYWRRSAVASASASASASAVTTASGAESRATPKRHKRPREEMSLDSDEETSEERERKQGGGGRAAGPTTPPGTHPEKRRRAGVSLPPAPSRLPGCSASIPGLVDRVRVEFWDPARPGDNVCIPAALLARHSRMVAAYREGGWGGRRGDGEGGGHEWTLRLPPEVTPRILRLFLRFLVFLEENPRYEEDILGPRLAGGVDLKWLGGKRIAWYDLHLQWFPAFLQTLRPREYYGLLSMASLLQVPSLLRLLSSILHLLALYVAAKPWEWEELEGSESDE